MEHDELYDEFITTSSSSDDDDDNDDYYDGDSLYEPSPLSKSSANGLKSRAESQKSFGLIHDEETIAAAVTKVFKDSGDWKILTVEQLKAYLRKHGLRLAGTKQVLAERIKEHLQIQDDSDVAKQSEAICTENCQGPMGVCEPVDMEIAKFFANLDLDKDSTAVIEVIKDGRDENKLTVEQCKIYLRKHGLRLAGTKKVLIERIKEHIQIQDDSGMAKYPEVTFTINCQGDACIGDVVLFKQRVYDVFNVGGRCSAGPPVGVRTVAGRIIKESYGSAKQQHTFTVEVLWSTGERALPPLHPLIIKGRNLYRVKTLRQAWPDEAVRKKQLQEKHSRGAAARMERLTRIERKKESMHPHTYDAGSHLTNDNGEDSKDKISYPATTNSVSTQCLQVQTADVVIHTNRVEHIPSIELRFNSALAGIIIGKEGANCNEIRRISEAELRVENDPADPASCIVKIKGTAEQRNVALKMVYKKTCCKFFSQKGECRNGGSCKFSHALPV